MSDNELNNKIVEAFLQERRSDRRWRNIRFAGWMVILIIFIILIFTPSRSGFNTSGSPYVALVRLTGVISSNATFSAKKVVPLLNRAFADRAAKGVILLINSPGGSPVQAAIIHDKILQLKKRYHKKVVVVGEDTLASGAYLVASAADDIYVNKDTITGSIGVIMSGFGFTDLIKKIGVTRRVFTAGSYKDRIDPFKALMPADVAKVKTILDQVHQNFIQYVKQGRGKRLHGDLAEIFSGDFWTGEKALQYGLVDGNADLWQVMAQTFKVTRYRAYSQKKSLVDLLFGSMVTELSFKLQNNAPLLKEQLAR